MQKNLRGLSLYSKLKQGFTIVELLIVVVVIAILASITIVSYNGVTKSAKNSAIQGILSQASQKLELAKMNSTADTYPASLSDAGIDLVSSGDTVYTYAPSSDSKLFCLASSRSGRTYYVTSTIRNPKPGICNASVGVAGTGDVATDGASSGGTAPAPVVATYSIFNGQTPSTTQLVYSDGGGSLKIGDRFYTSNANGISVKGLRIYNPSGADSTFLSLGVTAYAYLNDWTGSNITRDTTFGSSPVATQSYSGTRTAGTWTDIMFSTPFTLPKISGASGAPDALTLAIQYTGGNHYVFVTPSPNGGMFVESTVQPGTYLAEGSGVGRGVNTLVNGSDNSYYGIDLLFSTIP